MMHEEDIPVSVSINEVVELAKVYGMEESSKFVNGILGRIATELKQSKQSS
jgi:N utilization substance protein B